MYPVGLTASPSFLVPSRIVALQFSFSAGQSAIDYDMTPVAAVTKRRKVVKNCIMRFILV